MNPTHEQLESLVTDVIVGISFLQEQGENGTEYLIGVRHSIQNLLAFKVSRIVGTFGIDIDAVADFIKFDDHVKTLSMDYNPNLTDTLRSAVKIEINNYFKFVRDNI